MKLKIEALQLRTQRIAKVCAYSKKCLDRAEDLRREASKLLAVRHENDAEYELARRAAKLRVDGANNLRKKGLEFMRRAWWFKLYFWGFPESIGTNYNWPPSAYESCRSWAQHKASSFEIEKITNEGVVLHTKLMPAKKEGYQNYERRLVRHRERIYLAMMVRNVKAQPHHPWHVYWVTDSRSQMTEKELRFIANEPDTAVHV
ncbi:MAG: hypothetical protein JKX80_02030 [Candidatus Pacebacteria bacterium]|nr:hypothetical protein [Candidatus Paceibacterota bacterium]